MKVQDVIGLRLANQRLNASPAGPVEDVVRHFGAMQAQDYYGAKWAVGQRCDASDDAVERTFNDGQLLRTHLCRPTWHFVLPQDIRWILALTAPRVHQASSFMYRKSGLDSKLLNRATSIIAKALEGGRHADRESLMAHLQRARIDTSEFRSVYFMMYAELEGVVCSGPRQGKRFTYALLEERVPAARPMQPDEALAELTRRYFTSRGPACIPDFMLWSGLTVAQAKKGIAMVGKEFDRTQINSRENWHTPGTIPARNKSAVVHLLPNYDEYGIGYKDRSAFHDPAETRLSGARADPVFRNLVILNGRMVGTWDRVIRASTVSVKTSLFTPLTSLQARALRLAIERYAKFLGAKVA